MNPAASDTLFVVGFTGFVIAFVVLIVLVVRFTLRQAGIAKRSWLEARDAEFDDDPDVRSAEDDPD